MVDDGLKDRLEGQFGKLPRQLNAPYSLAGPNEPIELVSGPMRLLTKGGVLEGRGSVHWRWVPRPRIVFQIRLNDVPDSDSWGNVKLELPSFNKPIPSHVLSTQIDSDGQNSVEGIISEAQSSADTTCRSVTFLLPNFSAFIGAKVRTGASAWSAARVNLTVDDWLITIDRVAKDIQGAASRGDHLITHVGEIRSSHGNNFTLDDISNLLDQLHWYFTFCRAARTGPILPVGLDASGNIRWRLWEHQIIYRSDAGSNWLIGDDVASVAGPFSGFHKRMSDVVWSQAVRHAIHWHSACSRQPIDPEGSLILLQAALETLAWTYLVSEQKILGTSGFSKLPAADIFRVLLSKLEIPFGLDARFPDLHKLARSESWIDGADSLVGIRNALVHTDQNKISLFGRASQAGHAIWNAYQLGMEYLELVLLRLFGFDGKYKRRPDFSAECVPWARD